MNFYKHHLGDYDGATAHLSWDEDMAYTRLLRAYYRREKPILPAEAHRLCRAAGKAQRAAVDRVLEEFFESREDGWHNKRADEEISAYQHQADTNRRIARSRIVQRTVDEPSHETTDESSTIGKPNHEPLTKNQKKQMPLPPDFSISDRVRTWAEKHGFGALEAHFENFVGVARAKGYRYADWDEALMGAIRKNWAGISGDKPRLAL